MANTKKTDNKEFDPKEWAQYRKNKDGSFTGLVPKTKPAKTRVGKNKGEK